MNQQEKYLFDLQGYLVVPHALSAEEVAVLNKLMTVHIEREAPPDVRTHRFRPLAWEQPFVDLMDHPNVYAYLEELLGEGFRLDHAQADLNRAGRGPAGTNPHGGGTPFTQSAYYHFNSGKMYNGLVTVVYFLNDVDAGDGGFTCLPGSHKANYPLPEAWRGEENLPALFQQLHGPAGTAILFTEALTHLGAPWRGKVDRRTLFYRYSPHCLAWGAYYFTPEDFSQLSERQRAMLEPPNARYPTRHEHVQKVIAGKRL